MIHSIQLKDLNLGKIDAKNELIDSTEEAKREFLDSFLAPENFVLDDFVNHKKFYILGFKGIGKTALLHYMDLRIQKEFRNSTSHFILFKSEIKEDDFGKVGSASNSVVVGLNHEQKYEGNRYSDIWRWFLYRQISSLAYNELKKGTPIFNDDKAWRSFYTCVSLLNTKDSLWSSLFPKVKRGSVKIEGDFKVLKANLGIDLEWENIDERRIKFSNLVSTADSLFKELKPTGRNVYLFIDELEVSFTTKKQYDRDVQLIRDLVLTVYQIHIEIRRLNYPIRIIVAIRSEVQNAAKAIGQEMNKPLFDFGLNLKWQQSGGDLDNHPLIKMINKRINSSERKLGLEPSDPDTLWKKYFPPSINNQKAKEYILRRTWYRPRDVVRLLNLCKEQYPNEVKFTHQVFDGINKDYSSQSWNEMTEELSTTYSPEEIDGIKRMLMGIPGAFTYKDVKERNDILKELYPSVDRLLKKHSPNDILEKLYAIGIIGNTGGSVRYAFRGDDVLILTNKMKVHDPLWNYLSVQRPEK